MTHQYEIQRQCEWLPIAVQLDTLPSHLLPVLNSGFTLSYVATLTVTFCSFLIGRASQDFLRCMSSPMLLGVLGMYGTHTKCTNPITDSTAEEKNRSICFYIGGTIPALALGNACSVQCSAHWLCTHLFSMHSRKRMLYAVVLRQQAL